MKSCCLSTFGISYYCFDLVKLYIIYCSLVFIVAKINYTTSIFSIPIVCTIGKQVKALVLWYTIISNVINLRSIVNLQKRRRTMTEGRHNHTKRDILFQRTSRERNRLWFRVFSQSAIKLKSSIWVHLCMLILRPLCIHFIFIFIDKTWR